jgi:hypothetical protein
MPRRIRNMEFYKEILSVLGLIGVGRTSQAAKRTPADLTKREVKTLYHYSVRSVVDQQNFDAEEYLALLERLNIGSDDAYWITKHKYRPEVTVPLARKYFPNLFPAS